MAELTTPGDMSDMELRVAFSRVSAIAYQHWASSIDNSRQHRTVYALADDQKTIHVCNGSTTVCGQAVYSTFYLAEAAPMDLSICQHCTETKQ